MAEFKQAILKTIAHEGGYENNPHDAGNYYNGINYGTKYGITPRDVAKYFPELISNPNCVRDLTVDQAITVYKAGYWKELYSQINDQLLAEKLFDMGVLLGVATAVKILQVTIEQAITIVPDGAFGEQTLSDVNQENSADLLARYRTTLIQHFINIVNNHPDQGVFVNGWVARVNS